MSKHAAALCVVFAACSVYEPSLLGTGRNVAKGGANSAGGVSSGGRGEAGEPDERGGSTSGGALATGGTFIDAGAGGDAQGGGPATGGAAQTTGGLNTGGAESGGRASGGSNTSGGLTSGGSSGGKSSGGAANGGATSGGVTAAGSAGSAGKAGGGSTNTGGAPSTGGQGGGGAGATGVLFSDDFETGSASAWSPNTSGDFSVVRDGTLVYRQGTVQNSLRASSVGNAAWQDQSVQARVKVLTFGGTSTSSSYLVALYARYTDENNHYYVALRSDGRISIRRKLAGSNSSIGGAITPGALITTGRWYTVKLEVSASTLKAYVDGVLYDTVTDTSFVAGKAGVGTNNAAAVFDDFVVSLP